MLIKVFGHGYMVLSTKYLDEIKLADQESLSFFQALSEVSITLE